MTTPPTPDADHGRFVILHHHVDGSVPAGPQRVSHFDLMLEKDEVLWTWEWMQLIIDESLSIRRLFDHRLDYLTYEGPLSQNRGSVNQIAAGHFAGRCDSDGVDVLLQMVRAPSGWPPQCRLKMSPVGTDGWQGLLQTVPHDIFHST